MNGAVTENLTRVRRAVEERLSRRDRGRVHFVGVGGVGMAGLARLLVQEGWRVSGSDVRASPRTETLAAAGVEVRVGQSADGIPPDTAWVVHTAAVGPDHPELLEANRRGLPVFRRAAVLAAWLQPRRSIAVSGTHGKTTTTALLATLLRQADPDSGYVLGWEMPALEGLAAAGNGGWVVAEVDESDGWLPAFSPGISVITNVDFDHMEHFSSEADFVDGFGALARNTAGCLVACAEDPTALALSARAPRRITYGMQPQAQVRAVDVRLRPDGSRFRIGGQDPSSGELQLALPGRHNVLNALAAVAVGREVGLSWEDLSLALARVRPPARRLEEVAGGRGVTVFSDYAHHPTEIRAVLETLRLRSPRRLVMLYQPHRFSRTLALGAEFPPAFELADRVVLTPVYAASEDPLDGGTTPDLLQRCRRRGLHSVDAADSLEQAWERVLEDVQPGDLLLLCGAGDIDDLRHRAVRELGPPGHRTPSGTAAPGNDSWR